MKLFKQKVNGMPALTVLAQDEADRAFLNQFVGSPLIAVNASTDARTQVQFMVDLTAAGKPRARDRFDGKTHDDLLDAAARRGLDVPRTILREDLEQIILAHEEDPETAKEMIKMARPAPIRQSVQEVTARGGVSGGTAKFKTGNRVGETLEA